MLKKNSWIAALLLALSLTAFFIIGCVSPLAVVEDTETYEEYPLDKGYNAWAGQVYQKGWAIGGIKFQGKGDAIVIAKDLGYDIEMFQKATKLKIEMPDASYPRSGVDIIWGGEDENGDATKGGGMWNQQPIAGGSGDLDPTFAKKDGNILIIDLKKALKNYSAYTKGAKLKIVMQVNAPSYGDVEGLVQKAYLMIPNTPPPFVPLDNITLVENTMFWSNDLQLDANFEPENATEQKVIWAIKQWSGGGKTLTLPTLDPTDPASVTAYETARTALFEKVRFQREEYVFDDSVVPNEIRLKQLSDIIYTPGEKASLGTVIVYALVKNAKQDDKGNLTDFDKSMSVTVKDPPKFTYKLNGVDVDTEYWGAVDNGGVKGGKMEIANAGKDGKRRGYTITLGDGYGNSHHYIKIDLGEKFENYAGGTIKCKFKGVEGDCNLVGKTVRVRVNKVKPPRKYAEAGPYAASIQFPGGTDVLETGLEFEFFKDKGEVFTKIKDGVVADMPTPNQTINGKQVPFKEVTDSNTVYIWFVPWSSGKKDGAATKFTISDIEITKR